MDRQQLTPERIQQIRKQFETSLSVPDLDSVAYSTHVNLKESKPSVADKVYDILEQRKDHKEKMLSFVMTLTVCVTIAFFALVFFNATGLALTEGKIAIVDNVTLQIIAVSFFVQLAAVVGFITKALWDDKGLLASPLLRYMHRNSRDK